MKNEEWYQLQKTDLTMLINILSVIGRNTKKMQWVLLQC